MTFAGLIKDLFTPIDIEVTEENVESIIKQLEKKFDELKIVNVTEKRC